MYLNEMNNDEINLFLEKFSIRELCALQEVFNCFNAKYDDPKAKSFEKKIIIRLCYENAGEQERVDFYEFKQMLQKMSFGELHTLDLLLYDIKDESERYKAFYEIVARLYMQAGKIVMCKNIENLDMDEIGYFLGHISSHARENYSIDAGASTYEITPTEFYNYYHDYDIRSLQRRKGENNGK